MKEVLIEQGVKILAALCTTILSIVAAWLGAKLDNNLKLKNLKLALDTCLEMTKVTVGELQQKFVDDMKIANADGKLTEDEIKSLNSSLLVYTKEKMTPQLINVIVSAGIDINKYILDAGEYYVRELKHE